MTSRIRSAVQRSLPWMNFAAAIAVTMLATTISVRLWFLEPASAQVMAGPTTKDYVNMIIDGATGLAKIDQNTWIQNDLNMRHMAGDVFVAMAPWFKKTPTYEDDLRYCCRILWYCYEWLVEKCEVCRR